MLSALLKKLIFVNQFSMADGKIEVLGQKQIMLSADSLLGLQDIDESEIYKLVKDATKKDVKEIVEHSKVYKQLKEITLLSIIDLSKKIDKTDEGTLSILSEIFNIYGLGKLEIVNLENEKKSANVMVMESSIAQAQLKKRKSKNPVCSITAGVLAGIFSYLFKKSVDASEISCLAQEKSFCEFVIK